MMRSRMENGKELVLLRVHKRHTSICRLFSFSPAEFSLVCRQRKLFRTLTTY